MTPFRPEHPDDQQIAAYVDGVLPPSERVAMQAHLAQCPDCRAAVRDVARVVDTFPGSARGSRWMWAPAAAVAAAALLWIVPTIDREPPGAHRDEFLTASGSPSALVPRGEVDTASAFLWSSVPYATTYRVRLFDGSGTLLLERETQDTALVLPDSITLVARAAYFWRVEAQTGFDRWSDSELIEFVPREGAGR